MRGFLILPKMSNPESLPGKAGGLLRLIKVWFGFALLAKFSKIDYSVGGIPHIEKIIPIQVIHIGR